LQYTDCAVEKFHRLIPPFENNGLLCIPKERMLFVDVGRVLLWWKWNGS